MSARAVVGSAILALVVLQSCTAVLGMDRATLDESADASTGNNPGNTTPTNSACTTPPMSACTDCLKTNCGTAYANCIADSDCRVNQLDAYAYCLGDTCNSRTSEECALEYLMDPTLKNCLSLSKCASDCHGTTLASLCDLYCGCLSSCDTEEWRLNHPETPIPSTESCLTKCATDSTTPGFVECLRDHCEYGQGDLVHCEHAMGIRPACDRAPSMPSAGCLGLSESGWACNSPGECCSMQCSDHACN